MRSLHSSSHQHRTKGGTRRRPTFGAVLAVLTSGVVSARGLQATGEFESFFDERHTVSSPTRTVSSPTSRARGGGNRVQNNETLEGFVPFGPVGGWKGPSPSDELTRPASMVEKELTQRATSPWYDKILSVASFGNSGEAIRVIHV